MANNPTQLTILQDEIRRRYDTLSKRLKQVARYILDNSNSVAFDTVASIAQQADVPPSTLIRFANAFGFSGFNEMKQMFKQHLMEETANYTERARLFRQTTSDESSPPETPTVTPPALQITSGTTITPRSASTIATNICSTTKWTRLNCTNSASATTPTS